MELIEKWVSEYQNERTQAAHRKRFSKFMEWTQKTADELSELSTKDAKHLILRFQADMKKREMANNSILSIITSVRSFYTYLEKSIKFRRGQLVSQKMATGFHNFSNGDLSRMYNSGNAFDKALLAVGVSLGWEVSAMLDIDRKEFQRFVRRARAEGKEFFSFETQREKTGAKRFGILNALAIESLERYFEVSEGKAEQKLFPITKTGVSKLLKRLAREANIVLTGNVRWHNLRSWLMSKLNTAGFSEFEVKYLLGKKIPLTDMTYLLTLEQDILTKYPNAYVKYLCITEYEAKKKYRDYEEEITKLRKELEENRLIMRGMAAIYGKEILEKAKKELGNERSAKIHRTRKMTRMERMLMIIAQETEPIED